MSQSSAQPQPKPKPLAQSKHSSRLQGLDVARFLALIGMVIVNFGLVLSLPDLELSPQSGFAPDLSHALQGRAAALFVVLAGVGFGLGARSKNIGQIAPQTIKRAVFLLILGLLNMLIFPADILHYYAIYFVFGLCVLRLKSEFLWLLIVLMIISVLGLHAFMDYEAGWNWDTLDYAGFWTPSGFVRNLFFNGWHPVFPWAAFLGVGIWIARLDLRAKSAQIKMMLWGWLCYGLVALPQRWTLNHMSNTPSPDVKAGEGPFVILFQTSPIPPLPFYMMSGICFAFGMIGLCLWIEPMLKRSKLWRAFALTGRQSLSLYIAHIVIGMGVAESLGLLEKLTPTQTLIYSFTFCGLCVIYAILWSRRFSHGPLEALMRKLT